MLGIFIWGFSIYKGNLIATKVIGMNILEKFRIRIRLRHTVWNSNVVPAEIVQIPHGGLRTISAGTTLLVDPHGM